MTADHQETEPEVTILDETRPGRLDSLLDRVALPRKEEVREDDAGERIEGAVIGEVAGIGSAGEIMVTYPGNRFGSPLPAMSTVAVTREDLGKKATLVFEAGDPLKPILLGLIRQPVRKDSGKSMDVRLDGKRLTFTAEEEIVLRCGKASITLNRAGKIIIRGTCSN